MSPPRSFPESWLGWASQPRFSMPRARPHVLGLHPTSRGFGWVLLEDARSCLDWGTVDVRIDDENVLALDRIKSLLKKTRPNVLAVEAHVEAARTRCQRIQKLYRDVMRHAGEQHICVFRCSRAQIASSFNGAKTRLQVAAAIAERLKVLGPRLPKPRQIWVGEQSGLRVFSAAACALAYFDNDVSS